MPPSEPKSPLKPKIAFSISLLALLLALMVPIGGRTVLLATWFESIRGDFSRPGSLALIFHLFFMGIALLWLVSPFLIRVYSQSGAIRTLVTIISIAVTGVMALLFLAGEAQEPRLYAFLLAAAAHLIGMALIEKEEPGQDLP